MNFLFWGLTISVIGKMFLASGVLIAHSGIAHEMRIDSAVLKGFKIERVLTIIGVVLIILGYLMEIYFYGFATTLLTCTGAECMASLPAAISP
jgi:hypothetical protein